jgi:hypothetical protein
MKGRRMKRRRMKRRRRRRRSEIVTVRVFISRPLTKETR